MLIAWSFLLSISLYSHSKNLVISNVSIVDVETGEIQNNQYLLIKNGVIQKISSNKIKSNSKLPKLDGTGQFLIPGLIDSHVHYFQSGGLYTRPDALNFEYIKSYEEELIDIKSNLEDTFSRYLASGITSTLDAGGPMWNLDVRNQASKLTKAPNVKVAGPLFSTNYHPKGLESEDLAIISVQNFEQVKPLMIDQISKGVDLIKIWFIRRDKRSLEEHKPLIKNIIEEGHKHGVRVAVHATEFESAKLAVQLGADILVHGIKDQIVDDALIEMMLKNKVVYIPTLQVSEGYTRTFTQQLDFDVFDYKIANPFVMSTLFDLKAINIEHFSARIKQYLASKPEIHNSAIELQNLFKLQNAGVTIATGTDAGNIGTLPGSSYFKEVALMAKAGLTPLEILQASTIGGSKAMGMQDKVGLIKEGYQADLILLNNNPLREVSHLSTVSQVIKVGEKFEADDIIAWSPTSIVQRQVNAYNGRNIEAFLDTYSDDIEIYRMSEGKEVLSYKGKARMRKIYNSLFERFPELHCEVKSRERLSEFVIKDFEKVTGLNGKSLESFATYTIKDGLIAKVVFSDK